MTSIFDVPMTSDDLKEIEWWEAAGRDEDSFLARGFAIDGALGDDPRHRSQAFEAMCGSNPRRWEHNNRSPFLSAVASLGGLGRASARVGRIEKLGDACEQFALIELESDDVVAASLLDCLDHAAVAMD